MHRVMTVKYFAYGSNMADDVMSEKCPAHRFLDAASLAGFELAFTRRSIRTGTGVADIVPGEGSTVWGALYELEDRELEALDRKEGSGWAYRQVPVVVRSRDDGSEHEALTYTVIDKESPEVPSASEYLERVIQAARDRGLPDDYVRSLELRREHAVTTVPAAALDESP